MPGWGWRQVRPIHLDIDESDQVNPILARFRIGLMSIEMEGPSAVGQRIPVVSSLGDRRSARFGRVSGWARPVVACVPLLWPAGRSARICAAELRRSPRPEPIGAFCATSACRPLAGEVQFRHETDLTSEDYIIGKLGGTHRRRLCPAAP